ncbi:WapI family immunity protein [Alkalihalobacillus sp. CinArs1]|uniref:WapI family immunity protein n=1 Tax=Alkalihalobacillus sp. CinArs1 TaxID=2995314 RepID=UPI0022DE8092|nr:hypothetical protein [Alkalihalobacillus sp. CinArs1]
MAVIQFQLLGDKSKIAIEVLGRKYPDSTDYWDGNWIDSYVLLKIPGYSAKFRANVRTNELLSFLEELKTMNETLKGKAVLENMEDFILLEGRMDALGNVMWSGETCYPMGTGAILNFTFESDQSYLTKLIEELIVVVDKFPVIGKP